VYGCCPVFLFLFFYVEYGIIIHEGIKILTESKNHLTLAVTLYIIFQLIVGTLFYLVACYRMVCDKRMISPHLIELEKETYEIKESEIQDIRTEIQLAKQQKETEPKPDLETNLPIQVQRAV